MLRSYTKDAVSANQRSKIYFCAHTEDMGLLQSIADDILFHQPGTSIWYYDDPICDRKDRRHENELVQMQVFVIPVTSKFLQEPNAGLDDFRFAIHNGIPVLPLMQEENLEVLFNQVCGSYQFLDKRKNDPTTIPYELKIDRFLKAHLVDDHLVDKLRSAFCAYIFVSYRQKDRASAQELMRRIHENEQLRDVAIWYDEFLTAGENFEDVIRKTIDDSNLVAFTVTPCLLEEGNYIQREDGEFDYAKSKEKPLMPVEVRETNQARLKELYDGIPDCISMDEIQNTLEAQLNRLSLAHRPNDTFHTYLLGLAYLNGIHVETNKARGIGYIESAYHEDKDIAFVLPEAAKTLAEIYYWGNGVKPDVTKAARYQCAYCQHLLEAIERDNSISCREELVREAYWLGEMYSTPCDGEDPGSTKLINRGAAAIAYYIAYYHCKYIVADDPDNLEFLSYYALGCAALSNMTFHNAMLSHTPSCIKENLELSVKVGKERIDVLEKHIDVLNKYALKGTQFSLAHAYFWLADNLLRIPPVFSQIPDAEIIELYKKAANKEAESNEPPFSDVRTANDYLHIAWIYHAGKQYDQAIEYYQKVIGIHKAFPKEHFSYKPVENMMVESLGSIADIMADIGRMDEAAAYYKELRKYRLIVPFDDE